MRGCIGKARGIFWMREELEGSAVAGHFRRTVYVNFIHERVR